MRTAQSAAILRSLWTSRFETWAQPLSTSEEQKCLNAESVIKSALEFHDELTGIDLEVFLQGSYKANTNVRSDSDIDISIRCSNTYFYKLPPGVNAYDIPIFPVTLDFSTYRAKVWKALLDRFTATGVQDGNKAFKVRENTYRICADVVPTFVYKEFYRQGSDLYVKTGSAFLSKSGRLIVNWPEETYSNGVLKNNRTMRRYKKVVRILKGLRNEMDDAGYPSAKKISSFQISCLAYNVMDVFYLSDDLYDVVQGVVSQIWFHALDSSRSGSWTEIDEIKPLFPADQPNKAREVSAFFWDVMQYVGFAI